jgi:MFS transporter, PPP family, 3-phenylpropionic acid transporter
MNLNLYLTLLFGCITSPTVISFLLSPVMCAMADKLRIQRSMLLCCLTVWCLAQCLVLTSSLFIVQAAVCLVTSIASCPISSLVDAAVMTAIEDRSLYGAQRLYGAVGFGVVTLVVGVIVDSALGWTGVLALFALLSVATISICFSLKIEHSCAAQQPAVLEALNVLLRNREILTVFAVIVLSGAASGIIDTFLFVRLYDLGARGLCMGIARCIMCAAEVPLFHLSGKLLARWGVKPVIAIAQVSLTDPSQHSAYV